MSKKRSLADELAELFNPAPTKEFDADADPFGGGPALLESDEELAAQVPRGRRGKEKAMRLRGEIELDDAQYKGRRTSASQAFGSGSGSGSEGGSLDEDQDEGDDDDDDDSAGEGEQSEGEQEVHANGAAHGLGGSSSEEGGSGSDEDSEGGLDDGDLELEDVEEAGPADGEELGSDSEGASLEEGGSPGQSDSEAEGLSGDEDEGGAGARSADDEGDMAALEREYEELRAAEADAAAGLRERAAKERQKALSVQAQQQLWQRGLEMRILLQRVLQGANKLPQASMQAVVTSHSDELQSAYGALVTDAAGLLEDMSQLAEALHQQNSAVSEAAAEVHVGQKRRREEAEGGPPSSEQLWSQLDDLYSSFAPFRDASIDRWHRKTTLTTGGAVRSSLKALNQSVSTQVAAMMRDPHKLILRTRMTRLHSRPLCALADGEAETQKEGEAGSGGAYDGDDERDPETFDDTEFYQTLLKEFLEGSNASGGGNWLSGPKQRKAVDRRASKGRKIRYHVHEKLVNFMTPVDLDAPQFATQLFGNLFGGTRSTQPLQLK